jgi:HAD superfamily hydrolase (TIGR01662 family)
MMIPRLLIFDADGTLRWTTVPGQRYPLGADEWRLMPGVAERLRAIPWSKDGPWLAIASNQCGIGEGLIDRELARRLLVDCVIAAAGGLPARAVIDFCSCAEGTPCPRQKPAPGLLSGILRQFPVQPTEALYVGDLEIDRMAAERAGIAFQWAGDFFAAPSSGGAK